MGAFLGCVLALMCGAVTWDAAAAQDTACTYVAVDPSVTLGEVLEDRLAAVDRSFAPKFVPLVFADRGRCYAQFFSYVHGWNERGNAARIDFAALLTWNPVENVWRVGSFVIAGDDDAGRRGYLQPTR